MNPIRYLRDGYRWLVDPYGFLDEALARHGLTFRVRLPVLGDVLMTGDPRLVGEIVNHKDLGGGKAVTALRAILGTRSLIMLEGEAHSARRRLVAPLLRGDALRAYDDATIRATREWIGILPRGQIFSMYKLVQQIALRVMVEAMFGFRGSSAVAAETVVQRFLESFQNPLVLFLRPLRINAGPWSPWGRAMRNRRELCNMIREQMPGGTWPATPDTILGQLLAAGLVGDDLIEEVLSLLLFGHDTAAATMAWAFAHICSDADAVSRIRDEAAALGDALAENLHTLTYLDACIHESMRLCPVVVHLARTAAADLRLGDFKVRRGQKVIPCTYLAQHNPAVFPEPHAFRPERFLGGQRFEHSYYPFGFGSRTCVGKPFALRQMLLVIATAVLCADLELAPGYRPTPARHLVLIVPKDGTPMRVR